MAKIKIEKSEEYISVLFAISGELAWKNFGEASCLFTKDYLQKKIKKMVDSGIAKIYRYPDQNRYYRLQSAKAEELLSETDRENILMNHFNLMVGAKNGRYKGSKDQNIKKRKLYEVCSLFTSLGIEVDLLSIEQEKGPPSFSETSRSVFLPAAEQRARLAEIEKRRANGEKITEQTVQNEIQRNVEDIMQDIKPDVPSFLTGKVLRNFFPTGLAFNSRIIMHKALGILYSNTLLYFIYVFNKDIKEGFFTDIEVQFSSKLEYISRQNLKAFDGIRLTPTKRKAIFYVKTAKELREILNNNDENHKGLIEKAMKTYSHIHIIPTDENAEEITEMIITPEWKKTLNALLSDSPSSYKEEEDGFMEDGSGMFNFLGCDVTEIIRKKERIKLTKGTVWCHEWMCDVIKEFLGEEVTILPADEEMIKDLLKIVTDRRKQG